MDTLRIGCVVMAAGNASRFGENKLIATLGGKMLITRALEAVPAEMFSCVVVVTQHDAVEKEAHTFGFTVLRNDRPDLGLSHTVQLGTEALKDCDAILYLVADQPLLQRERVRALVEYAADHPEHIIAMSHRGRRGNPCLFPARFYPQLMALTGDHGGRSVIEANEASLLLFEAPEEELIDVDTPNTLAAMKPMVE